MTIAQTVQKIMSCHPQLPDYCGCDGFKSGDPDMVCTGIACALVPTVDVIRKTAEMGYNLLYVHEPSYYLTPDYPVWKGGFRNTVYEEKRRLLDKHGIAVFRDHDHTHAHEPDGIFSGVIRYLGWEAYQIPSPDLPACYLFDLPKTSVEALCQHLMEKIGMRGVRYIGSPAAKVRRVAIVAHLYPGAFVAPEEKNGIYTDYATEIIRLIEHHGVEAVIPGEIIEWNLLSYIADAAMLGRSVACINIGHFNLEELGARYAAEWIGQCLDHVLPVSYIHTGELWRHMSAESSAH